MMDGCSYLGGEILRLYATREIKEEEKRDNASIERRLYIKAPGMINETN
jgi:hypothetical protein